MNMKLVKVNPAYGFEAVDRLLHDFFQAGLQTDRYAKSEFAFQPAVNIYEFENAYKLEMQIPGFSKEQVKISLDKDVLVVKGELSTVEKEDAKHARIGFKTGNFEKKFQLPDNLNPEKIQANFENGILTLSLAKREEAQPVSRNIEIA